MYHQFTPANLEFAYKWENIPPHDNSCFISKSDTTILNRSNGYEMLYFIRSLAKSWDWNDPEIFIERAKQLEGIIMEEVPIYLNTQAEIKQWIESRYEVS